MGFDSAAENGGGGGGGAAGAKLGESLMISRRNRMRAVRIDEYCRFVFPVGFAIFNAIYWKYYKEEEYVDPYEMEQEF